MNIVDSIFKNCDRRRMAVITPTASITYGVLEEQVDRFAAHLNRLPDYRIGLFCPDGLQYIILALAIIRARKCLVPLAFELTDAEREAVKIKTHLETVLQGNGEIIAARQPDPSAFNEEDFVALNPAFVRFSSGTTGTSKGIVISHETLRDRMIAANKGFQISSHDRIVWILPMAHHFAVSIMLYLYHGATTLLPKSHLAEDVLDMAIQHKGTVLYGAPFHHALLAVEASKRPWPSLRLAVSTASTLTPTVAINFQARYRIPLTQGFGIIEVGMPCLNLKSAETKSTSIGCALPDYEVQSREGELWVRGPGMLDAYLDPWQVQESILQEGWFRTGDLGRCDAEGDWYLDGRTRSVINMAGMKCFPEEVEAVLRDHPAVRLAKVYGIPHERVGAMPAAKIIPIDPNAPPAISDLIAHCRKSLSSYKVPIQFDFVATIPLTPSGKVSRREDMRSLQASSVTEFP